MLSLTAKMSGSTVRVLRPPNHSVHGTLFMPEGREAVGAVVLIGGSGGTEPSYVAEPLAAEGLATLSLAYFGRPALPNELREIPLEYFRDALRLLIAALPSRLVPVAVLGMSRGSEAALLSAIQFGDLVNGLVLTVPGNLVVGSWPPGGLPGCSTADRCPTSTIPDLPASTQTRPSLSSSCPARSSCSRQGPIRFGPQPPWRGPNLIVVVPAATPLVICTSNTLPPVTRLDI